VSGLNRTPNKFRAITGQRRTYQMFHENWVLRAFSDDQSELPPLYTLNADVDGLPNFGKIYVKLRDKTGWKISQSHLEDFEHFQLLLKGRWFQTAKEGWDAQIDAALEAEAVDVVRSIAKDDTNKGQLAAARLLLDYSTKKTPTRGRPSKSEVEGELKRSTEEERTLREDAERLRLVK
jgi:hypothetical protein